MAQERSFTLVGNFKDNITPGLKKVTSSLNSLQKSLSQISGNKSSFSSIAKTAEECSKSHKKLTEDLRSLRQEISLTQKEFSHYNSTLFQSIQSLRKYKERVEEATKANKSLGDSSFDAARAESNKWNSATKSLEDYIRAASAAQRSAGEPQRGFGQTQGLLSTMLQANAFALIGDGIAQGFERGINLVMRTAGSLPNFFLKKFNEAAKDEMSDIRAQSGMMGALGMAGYKGGGAGGSVTFAEAGKYYKKIDQAVAEEIRTSAAPTGTVIELQRYTSDTLIPLLMKAQGIEKGADVRKVDPKKIGDMSKGYANLLGQVALLAQGTGTATFRVAQGVEGLITRGKIDTTMDFFTDNVLLMKALQDAGFAGGPAGAGGKAARVSSLKTEAERLKALKKALQVAMPKEGIEAMSTSLTGSLQALGDTISNPSVGLFGMASTFTDKEQKRVNEQLKQIFDRRMQRYDLELKQLKDSGKTDEETLLRIKQLEIDRKNNRKKLADLIKEGEEKISNPFKAFSMVFGEIVRNFTNVLNAIGPIWNRFAIVALDMTDKIMGPLAETLGNIASDMNKDAALGKERIFYQVGRVSGELYKFLGDVFIAITRFLGDPKGPMTEAQSEFFKGFLAAFKNNPRLIERAQRSIENGIRVLVTKLMSIIWSVVSAPELRGIVLLGLGIIFGPPLAMAVVSGLVPLILTWFVGLLGMLLRKTMSGGRGVASGVSPVSVGGLYDDIIDVTPKQLPPAGGMMAKVAPQASAASRAIGFLGRMASSTGEFFSRSFKVLGRFGTALLIVTSAIQIIGDLLSGKGLSESLASVAPGVVGTIVGAAFGPVGAIIGGMIGQWLSGFKPVTDFFEGVFRGLGEAIYAVTGTFGPILRSLIPILTEVWYMFQNLFNALFPIVNSLLSPLKDKIVGATKGFDFLGAAMIAVKVAMFPLVGTLFLVEAGLQGLRIGLSYANLKILEFRQFLSRVLNGGRENQALNTEIQNTRSRLSQAEKEFASSHARRMSYFTTEVPSKSSPSKAPSYGGPLMGGNTDLAQLSANSQTQNIHLSSLDSTSKISSSNITSIKTYAAPVPSKLDSMRSALMIISSKMDSLGQKLAVFDSVKSALMVISGKMDSIQKTMVSGGMKMTYSIGSGPAGGVDSFTPMAQSYGLQLTSGFRPGDPGWHGANRARDYSNGGGPTPQMMSFARFLASRFGANLKELIYTPLGFSIKNGQIVPPLAAGSHYNHVHVAYGLGAGNPAFFSSSSAARQWERKMSPANASISTVTSNSSEGFGGNATIHAPISIYQQPNQDPEELASIIIMRLSMAVEEARNHS